VRLRSPYRSSARLLAPPPPRPRRGVTLLAVVLFAVAILHGRCTSGVKHGSADFLLASAVLIVIAVMCGRGSERQG
jgi:hypothetical protein